MFNRERLVCEYETSGELLCDLGSDQTSCHNPYLGGYYPVQVNTLLHTTRVTIIFSLIYYKTTDIAITT